MKLFFAKLWLFIQTYWKYFLIIVGILAAVLFLVNKTQRIKDLLKELQEQSESHRRELDALQRVHEEQIRRDQEIENTYQSTIRRIEENYQQELEQLSKDKQQEIRRIVQETHEDPDLMSSRINELFGIPIYNGSTTTTTNEK